MSRTKKIIGGIGLLFLGIAVWYFWIKQYDYEISFRANTAPGSVYDQVLNLEAKQDPKTSISKILILEETIPYSFIKQERIVNGTPVILDWHFKSIADTITQITVGIIAKEYSIQNRSKILLGMSPLIELVKEDLISFRASLNSYTNSFKVVIDGEAQIPDMKVISVSSKTKRFKKANEMMRSNAYLYPKLKENQIEKNGFPFVKIKHWAIETDSIQLDFGFPIIPKDSFPVYSKIMQQDIPAQKAIKATYFGNYRNSDEAWFALLAYADKHNIAIEKKPLEIFYNNPMQGGDELKWKAEVFLPIKE